MVKPKSGNCHIGAISVVNDGLEDHVSLAIDVAISASNTGGAWDNAKKYIEAGASEHAKTLGPKGSDPHKAAVIGDTIGDPLKDTSGLSLNIWIKLMVVESLVFAPFFATHGVLLFKL
ncbi:hypothetical protein KI387_017023 [Taxus chinensis]|nr:hypothetical protein KI387_017023 [Taxus chinensis]